MNAPAIYLDYNATAPLRPAAHAAMQDLLWGPANPSSVHRFGRDAKKHMEEARRSVAEMVSAWSNEVVFCASGTEANHLALRGSGAGRVLVSAVEHSSVLKAAAHEPIAVDGHGIVKLEALAAMLTGGSAVLVSVMLANNETGVIQPIREIAALCHEHGALLHCDAVQALGKVPVDFGALGADMLTLSAHKCGGPVGAAALVVRRGLPLRALLEGGGQEQGRRAGTENVAALCGFAAALADTGGATVAELQRWRDGMEASLRAEGAIVVGAQAHRLPNTSCLIMPGVGSELQLMDFDLAGIAISAGSACSSGRIEPSHVLAAMGIEKSEASYAIRVSSGWATRQADIHAFEAHWRQLKARLAR